MTLLAAHIRAPASGDPAAYDAIMRFGGIAVVVGLLCGCFEPRISSEQFRCAGGLCPEGFRCEDGACVEGAVGSDPVDASGDAAASSGPCYGQPAMPIAPGQTVSGDTENAGFDNANGCNARGPENYWVLELDAADLPADVTFDALTTNYDLVLRVRQGICDDEVAEFVCEDPDEGDIATRSISVPGEYYIIIDSHGSNETGQYDLTVTLQ